MKKKKTIIGEDGNEYTVKEKKPIYKRVWFWVLLLFVFAGIGGLFGGDETPTTETDVNATEATEATEVATEATEAVTETQTEAATEPVETEPAIDLQDKSLYSSGVTYEDLARTPDDYAGEMVIVSGEIVQVIESETENNYRVAIEGDYDQMALVALLPDLVKNNRILEGDYVTFYCMSIGMHTYESAIGGSVTVPLLIANIFERSE